jgi:protein-disulfide isomerase
VKSTVIVKARSRNDAVTRSTRLLSIVAATVMFCVACARTPEEPQQQAANDASQPAARATPPQIVPPTGAGEDWVERELLLQLQEIRSDLGELKALKDEVRALRADVAKLTAVPAANPSGAQPLLQAAGTVQLNAAQALGSASAKVGIVEFSDFECPYCARHHQLVYPLIKQEFVSTGQVKYFARQFPLSFHARAKGASIAAQCAARQGKYWDMHDALFASQRSLGKDLYLATAKLLALDINSFARCEQDPATEKQIAADIAYGDALGVSGTPKFFVGRIDGERLVDVTVVSGAQPYAAFKAAIAAKLKS